MKLPSAVEEARVSFSVAGGSIYGAADPAIDARELKAAIMARIAAALHGFVRVEGNLEQ